MSLIDSISRVGSPRLPRVDGLIPWIVPLAIIYPRARTPALIFLAFVGCARIAVGAHWASDVFAGVVLVAVVTWICAELVRPLRWPDR